MEFECILENKIEECQEEDSHNDKSYISKIGGSLIYDPNEDLNKLS